MDPIQDLYTFVETTRRGMDTQTSNIFAASCGRWLRYYLFLQIIRARFAQESEAYTTEIYQYTERIQRSLSSGPRNMAPEEWQELQHIQSLEQLIHLEIESFYTFAKILLDRIADTFSYFYSVPLCKKGLSYSQLTTKFESVCTDRGSVVEPPDLLALMQDLKIHVTEFRTNRIEHFSAPGVMFGKSQNAQIVQTMLCPSIPSMPSEQTQDLDELLAKIDCFIPAIIQFFEANLKKSILHRTPSPSTY